MQIDQSFLSNRAFLFSATLILAANGLLLSTEPRLEKNPVVRLPGESFQGALPKITAKELEVTDSLKQHVVKLATEIGERNLRRYKELNLAADWLQDILSEAGYTVERQTYEVAKKQCHNLIAERKETTKSDEIAVICAHYDSAPGAAGANDNASGVAALLELAKKFSQVNPDRTLRLAFFTNEEPPHFQTDSMGSLVYAKKCREKRENISAAISLETIGYYSDEEGSQNYPFPLGALFPKTGNFIGFVGNVDSGLLTSQIPTSFRNTRNFHRKRPHYPMRSKESAGQINGLFGNSDTKGAW